MTFDVYLTMNASAIRVFLQSAKRRLIAKGLVHNESAELLWMIPSFAFHDEDASNCRNPVALRSEA